MLRETAGSLIVTLKLWRGRESPSPVALMNASLHVQIRKKTSVLFSTGELDNIHDSCREKNCSAIWIMPGTGRRHSISVPTTADRENTNNPPASECAMLKCRISPFNLGFPLVPYDK